MKNQKGFTLIEVVIYIALFTILMGGAFITSYELIYGMSKVNTKTIIQEEGNFLTRKLNWALDGLDSAYTPAVSGSGCNETLTVYKVNYSQNPIVIQRNAIDDSIEIRHGGGLAVPLTTVNVRATCLEFKRISPVGTRPGGVSATSTISGVDFAITKYERI